MNLFNRYIIIPKRLVQRLYILIFAIAPLIDSMNGYFLKGGFEGSLTIGSIYRMVLILFVACAVIGHLSKRNFICLSIIIGYFIFACIIQKVSGINSKSLLSEVQNLMQWGLIFVLFFSYSDLYTDKVLRNKEIEIIFSVWELLVPLTLIIPYVLGIGYNTYYDTGYKGFYYSTNALTYFLIILYTFSIDRLLKRITIIKLLKVYMIGYSLAMLGTKSGYVAIVVIPIICASMRMKDIFTKFKLKNVSLSKKQVKIYSVYLMFIIISLLGIAKLFTITYSSQIQKIISRHTYFWGKSSSLISFITTGRSDRISDFNSYIKESGSYLLRLIFGSGTSIKTDVGVIEMDYFDAFFMFGLIGTCIFIAFSIYVYMFREKENRVECIAYILTIAYSFLGGHVWNNAFATTCFAMVCAKLISKKKCMKKYRIKKYQNL